MKDKIQSAIDAYKAWEIADKIWDKARNSLEKDLQDYAKSKSIEFSKKHGLEKYYQYDDLFLVSLDGGCKADGWKPEGGFFSSLMLHEEGVETTWFEPTIKDTWMKFTMPESLRIGEEIPGELGPVPIKELKKLAKEMTKESGVKFYLHKQDYSSEFIYRGFDRISFLDGTTYYAPEKGTEYDNGDY